MKKFVCLLMAAMLALSLGVSVFAVQNACQHSFKTRTVKNQTECFEVEVQTYQTCTKCGWTEMLGSHTEEGGHMGPLGYEYNIMDGVEYRCQYCKHCGEIISCSRA